MYLFFTPNHSQKPHLQPILTQMESRGLKANHLNQTHRNKKKTKNLNPNPPFHPPPNKKSGHMHTTIFPILSLFSSPIYTY